MQAFEWLEAVIFSTNMAKSGGKLGYGGAGSSKVADMKALADSAAHGYTVAPDLTLAAMYYFKVSRLY
jgi:hypothetical protein